MDEIDLNCDYDVTGINAQFGYNSSIQNDCTNYNKTELMKEIQSLYFAINDLALYLNTHPTDDKALSLHNEYSNKLKDLKDKYQAAFGPLTMYCPCNKWKWLNNPWPWERSED